jgi:hypothetical protein
MRVVLDWPRIGSFSPLSEILIQRWIGRYNLERRMDLFLVEFSYVFYLRLTDVLKYHIFLLSLLPLFESLLITCYIRLY